MGTEDQVDVIKQGNAEEFKKLIAENPDLADSSEQKDILTEEEAERIERIIFEDDEEVTLRNGKKYKIPSANFKDARKLMKLLKTVNIEAIILNFLPTDDTEKDAKRLEDLYTLMRIAFVNYPEVNDEFLDRYVDLKIARQIIDILIDLNGLKK